MLSISRVVDLTRVLTEDIPMWPGQPPPVFETKLDYEKPLGVFMREVRFWEHTGTHIDAPAHFFDDGRTVDQLTSSELVRPAVVIDIRDACAATPNYGLTPEDVLAHERDHGTIPAGCVALVNTGWDKYFGDQAEYTGTGDPPTFPGISEAAARLLVDERKVVALGVDTIGIDPGSRVDFPIHCKVSLPKDVWHIEGLVRLDQVPPTGAWITVGVLPWLGGSGSAARVFALIG